MRSTATLVVGPGERVVRSFDDPPVAFRSTPEGVYLVGTAATPVGRDQVAIDVEVLADARLRLRSTAATVAWAGEGSSHELAVRVGERASLDWRPEPLIVTAGAHHRQRARVDLAPSARASWSEAVVLGREGERAGWAGLRLDVDVGSRPLLRHELRVGPSAASWDGPAVLGRHRCLGLCLVVGPDLVPPVSRLGPGWAWLRLDGPGWLWLGVADDLPELGQLLEVAGRPRFDPPSASWPSPDVGARVG